MSAENYWLERPRRLREDRRVFFGLALVLALLYLPGLGSYGLYDPWETHYGEVARNMVEYQNYIDPWWGSPWDSSGVKREREGFYSKPPLIMWMMAAGMEVAGYNELGVRLFFPMLSILALLAIYLAVSRFHNRRAGLMATVVCATVPFFAFMSRQAVTDGPMVAIMTAGVMFLVMALFLVDEQEETGRGLYWLTLALVVLVMAGQLWVMLPLDRSPDVVRAYAGEGGLFSSIGWFLGEVAFVGRGKGWVLALCLLPFAVWAGLKVARQKRRRMLYLYLFYICCGLVVPAKGWVAWAPTGGAIIAYLLVTGHWRVLATVEVSTGFLLVFMTGHPWIVAMMGGHHPGWFDRFVVYDHFSRLSDGVHSIDSGGFEYFVKWIGFGLFPFIGLLPGAIARVLAGFRRRMDELTASERFDLFIFLWVLVAFLLFTKSSTKFHHYIFPAIPGFAILIALFMEDVLQGKGRGAGILLAAGALVMVWVGNDLYLMPRNYGDASQNLVNLFTYKYDREWPRFTGEEGLARLAGDALTQAQADNAWLGNLAAWMQLVAWAALIGYVFMAFFKDWLRRYGAVALSLSGCAMGFFCLHQYLPAVSVSWSQKGMWDAYYADCTKFAPEQRAEFQRNALLTASRVPNQDDMFPKAWCHEAIVAFRTNWRGETFYSSNLVVPAPETKNLKPFLDEYGALEGRPFYLFTEKNRIKSELEPTLPKTHEWTRKEVFGDGKKFTLVRIEGKPKVSDKPADAPDVPEAPAPAEDGLGAPE